MALKLETSSALIVKPSTAGGAEWLTASALDTGWAESPATGSVVAAGGHTVREEARCEREGAERMSWTAVGEGGFLSRGDVGRFPFGNRKIKSSLSLFSSYKIGGLFQQQCPCQVCFEARSEVECLV